MRGNIDELGTHADAVIAMLDSWETGKCRGQQGKLRRRRSDDASKSTKGYNGRNCSCDGEAQIGDKSRNEEVWCAILVRAMVLLRYRHGFNGAAARSQRVSMGVRVAQREQTYWDMMKNRARRRSKTIAC
jgi:hypothetical protein